MRRLAIMIGVTLLWQGAGWAQLPTDGDLPQTPRLPDPQVRGRTEKQIEANRKSYVQTITDLVDLRDSQDDDAVAQARKLYTKARNLCSEDPRLPMALGIALLGQGESIEALKHFQSAMAADSFFLIPAAEVYVYQLVEAKKYEPVSDAAPIYATRLANMNPAHASEKARVEAAEWLGRLMGFVLSGPANIPSLDTHRALALADHDVSRILPPKLVESYQSGRFDIATDYFQKISEQTNGGPETKTLDEFYRSQKILEQTKTDLSEQSRTKVAAIERRLNELKAEFQKNQAQFEKMKNRASRLNLAVQGGNATPSQKQELLQLRQQLVNAQVAQNNLANVGKRMTRQKSAALGAYQKSKERAVGTELELAKMKRRMFGGKPPEHDLETYEEFELNQFAVELLQSYRTKMK